MSKRQEREHTYVPSGCIDARDIRFKGVPERVQLCPGCQGNGKVRYDRCYLCKGFAFVYKATVRPVPLSVVNQIAVASGVAYRFYDFYGMEWTKDEGARNR